MKSEFQDYIKIRKRGKTMYKWLYDRMVEEYEKEPKQELIIRMIAIEEIELSDRCLRINVVQGRPFII